MEKIPFNIPPVLGTEMSYLEEAISINKKLCGDGPFTKEVQNLLSQKLAIGKVLLTPSCTAALEMSAILCDIGPGDEVIMPSYTFVSTANAFVLRGARIVFVDIRPDTMNLDESLIEAAITEKTKAIVVVHYAGVACEMETIGAIAKKHKLFLIEDAAQGVMSKYKGRALGGIGDLGCFSFHETKNYTSGGEGGALVINNPHLVERAEVIREKGTDRSQFLRGFVDKYSWRDLGSSFLPSELQAAYLLAQIKDAEKINEDRLRTWNLYWRELMGFASQNRIALPVVPNGCEHNAHMFYLKFKDLEQRTSFIKFMSDRGIQSPFHYVPLHSSLAGKKFGAFVAEDKFTTSESEKLVRLPLWYRMPEALALQVISTIMKFS